MELAYFASLADGQIMEADVCIVGTGPAGLTLARELARSHLQVILLESGDTVADPAIDGLNEIESIGAPREMDQTLLRNRILGGTSTTWSGRTAFFDDIDFEQRDWVPHSGWPITAQDVRCYLPRTLDHLGIGVADNTDVEAVWRAIRSKRQRIDFDPTLLRDYFWQYSQDEANPLVPMRFGPRALRHKAANVRCILRATVTQITTTADGRKVDSIEIGDATGRRCHVRSVATVLCAGGVENARLLLASNRIITKGVGNQHDAVGRFLMDHPRGAIGNFDIRDEQVLQNRFGIYRAVLDRGTFAVTYGVALSPHIQRSEGLLNSAVWINEVHADDDPWMSIAAIMRRRSDVLRHLRNVGRNMDVIVAGLMRRFIHHRGVHHKLALMNLQCIVEQRPNPNSRITLADRADALGMPLSRIDWQVSEQESLTVKRIAQLFVEEMTRLGLPAPTLFDMARQDSGVGLSLPDVAHPIGTTRMSRDPRSGVVDANCAVHGVEGLYVAGSSIFPSTGHANPTQMIIALGVRLADHLKATLTQAGRGGRSAVNTMYLPIMAPPV